MRNGILVVSLFAVVPACSSSSPGHPGAEAQPRLDSAVSDAALADTAHVDGTRSDGGSDSTAADSLPPLDSTPPDTLSRDSMAWCGGSPCAQQCVAGSCVTIDAPRPIWPPSMSLVSSPTPTFKWALGAVGDGAAIDICPTSDCTTGTIVHGMATGTSFTPASALTQGNWFWRLRGADSGVVGTAVSPTWELTVSAMVLTPTVSTSWGTTLDLNLDGFADVAAVDMSRLYVINGAPLPLGGPSLTLLAPAGDSYSSGNGSVASVGDVNGDGYGDLSVAILASSITVNVYLGGPAGIQKTSTPITLATPPGDQLFAALGAGDVDGDGYGDLVAYSSTGAFYFFAGSSTGPRGTGIKLTDTNHTLGFYLAAPGDLNGDGYDDLVTSIGTTTGPPTGAMADVFLGGPSGPAPGAVLDYPSGLAVTLLCGVPEVGGGGDFNGDGYDDVVASTTCLDPASSGYRTIGNVFLGGMTVATAPAIGSPFNVIPTSGSSQDGIFHWAPAMDVNGDGCDDVVAATKTGGNAELHVYLGTPAATGLQTGTPIVVTETGIQNYGSNGALSAGDVDGPDSLGHSYADVVAAADVAGTIVYFGAASNALSQKQTATGATAGSVALGAVHSSPRLLGPREPIPPLSPR
jgi:hypothetical protein